MGHLTVGNGYRIRVYTEENLSSINVAYMNLIYWSVRLSCRRGLDGVKEKDRGIVLECIR